MLQDFYLFTMRLLKNDFWTEENSDCRDLWILAISESDVYITLSSAYNWTEQLEQISVRSLIKIENSKGPNIDPCGTAFSAIK